MKCGVAMLNDALSWFTKVKLEAGYVVVLETAGRAGHWNPHLHILMTSGGVTPQQQWREVDYFPFKVLHKKWRKYSSNPWPEVGSGTPGHHGAGIDRARRSSNSGDPFCSYRAGERCARQVWRSPH